MSAISGTRRSMKELVDGTLRVQIDIDPAFRDEFLRSFSKIDMPVALAPLVADFERIPADTPISVEQARAADTGHWVSALYKSGWWFNPNVLAALGTDKQYREWIQRQTSCVSNQFSEYVNAEGRCIAAHVRRAGESGTGYKAPYACVPLTDAEHQLQHREGESAFPGGAEWFDKRLAEYKSEWAHERLRAALGVASLKAASAGSLRAWAAKNDLLGTLPLAVRS